MIAMSIMTPLWLMIVNFISLNVDHVDDDVDGVDCDDGCGEGSGRRSIMMMFV